MELTLITGSYPPDICGVGDYTQCVYSTEFAKTNKWELFYKPGIWKTRKFFKIVRELINIKHRILVMEMPTMGYGKSLVPHCIVAYMSVFTHKKMVVRLHEYTNLSKKARLAISIVLLTANHVIFTNEFDRSQAANRFKRLKKRSSVVKIFSNIPKARSIASFTNREIDLIYFGHIRPSKGINEFIKQAETLKKRRIVKKCAIVGQIPKRFNSYFEEIKNKCAELSIEIMENVPVLKVSELLNNAKVAFLPFPDGLSERRGSFLAAIQNGCVVVSTIGKYTTESLNDAAILTNEEYQQQEMITKLLSDINLWNLHQRKGRKYLEHEMPLSWDDVAYQYTKQIQNI